MLSLVSEHPDKSLQPHHPSLWDYAMIKEKNLHSLTLYIDAIILADIADGMWRQLAGSGTDTHRIENRTSGGEITLEGTGRNAGQFCQLGFNPNRSLAL